MRVKDGFVIREVLGQAVVIPTGKASKEFYRGDGLVNMNGFCYKAYVRFWHYSFPIRYGYKKVRYHWGRVKAKISSVISKK